jgi:hypothetical protein
MAITAKLRKLIEARDPYCYHCGETNDLQIHHRRNRGMGGSKLLDTPDNLMRVCAAWNYGMESDSRVAAQARTWNHKMPLWEKQNLPVFDIGGGWWYLHEDGTKTQADWKDAAF